MFDASAASAPQTGDIPALREFIVRIKRGTEVRQTLSVMGTDSISVAADHECLCEYGEYVTATLREVCAFNKVESATEYAKRREREEQRAALLMQVQSNLRDPLTSRIYE